MSEVRTAAEAAPAAGSVKAKPQRRLTGRVVSDRMQKTVAVEIERLIRHARYGKYVRRTTRLLAHDEHGESHVGDLVAIAPCRPLSRRKAWRLVEVLEKAGAPKETAA
jgi:small subunit ribosomal protein S17